MISFATRQVRQLLHNQYDHINQILIITINASIRAFIYIHIFITIPLFDTMNAGERKQYYHN